MNQSLSKKWKLSIRTMLTLINLKFENLESKSLNGQESKPVLSKF